MPPPKAEFGGLPFKEAIAFFRSRIANPQVSDRWHERMEGEHAAQFTVARSIGYDILGDISTAMDKAIAEGTTFEEFAYGLKPLLQAKGWWGKVEREDGTIVQLGSMRRLRTIFNVNMRVSYAAGRWEQIQRTKEDLPYLAYSAVLDIRTRPAHRDWNGTVLPVDHPWWDAHYPPCGWNCRCSVIQLTESGARRRGGVTETPPSGPPKRWFNPTTGQTIDVPHGIDPGWGYNVGKAAEKVRVSAEAAKQMADKLPSIPAEVAAEIIPANIVDDLAEEFATWFDTVDRLKPRGEARVVGALADPVLGFLSSIGRAPKSGAISITDHGIAHILRDAKGLQAPEAARLRELPRLIASPNAVLWDNETSNLLYVVDVADDQGTRLVVHLDRFEKIRDEAGKRRTAQVNAVISGHVMDVNALQDRRRYTLVTGGV